MITLSPHLCVETLGGGAPSHTLLTTRFGHLRRFNRPRLKGRYHTPPRPHWHSQAEIRGVTCQWFRQVQIDPARAIDHRPMRQASSRCSKCKMTTAGDAGHPHSHKRRCVHLTPFLFARRAITIFVGIPLCWFTTRSLRDMIYKVRYIYTCR